MHGISAILLSFKNIIIAFYQALSFLFMKGDWLLFSHLKNLLLIRNVGTIIFYTKLIAYAFRTKC